MRLALLFLSFLPFLVQAAEPAKNFTISRLSEEIQTRSLRVQEFEFIRKEAEKLGVRAWLFGGTAASVAHYVKWDLLREEGTQLYPNDRFDYDFSNIFRSNQDIDVVIDGTPEQAEAFENLLRKHFPNLRGVKSSPWEVRLLNQDRGEKQAILDNPDFKNQHTDSNSTGLIEITKPPKNEMPVRDVLDWNSKTPQFLKDVYEGKLHYYFSRKHRTTKFYKEGRNPPIISVIRYLTKAFQFGLEVRPEDLEKIKTIVRDFEPSKEKNDYVLRWIEKNGKKLVQNSIDLESSWKTMDELGLRKKLMALRMGGVDEHGTLAWWLNRAPLKSKPIGRGSGRTAAEIFKKNGWKELVVAHATGGAAYESITKGLLDRPNALISRDEVMGEGTGHGEGFYTQVGRSGVGSRFTIRFELDPRAREGTDFLVSKSHTYVVVKNRAAIRMIPEKIEMSLLEYVERLARKEFFSAEDEGVLTKFRRRFNSPEGIDPDEMKKILKLVSDKKRSVPELAREWAKLPISTFYPEMTRGLFSKDADLIQYVLSEPHWLNTRTDWVEELIKNNKLHFYIENHVLTQPKALEHPEWMIKILESPSDGNGEVINILKQPEWAVHPEVIDAFVQRSAWPYETDGILGRSHWRDHPQLRKRCNGLPPTYACLKGLLWKEGRGGVPPIRAKVKGLGCAGAVRELLREARLLP